MPRNLDSTPTSVWHCTRGPSLQDTFSSSSCQFMRTFVGARTRHVLRKDLFPPGFPFASAVAFDDDDNDQPSSPPPSPEEEEGEEEDEEAGSSSVAAFCTSLLVSSRCIMAMAWAKESREQHHQQQEPQRQRGRVGRRGRGVS